MANECVLLKELLTKTKRPLKIKLLGDSITHGLGGTGYATDGEIFVDEIRRNPNGYCWAKLFSEYVKEKYNAEVVNNGISGTNIEGIIRRFERLVEEDDDFIICTIGTNNRHQYMRTGEKMSVEEISNTFYQNVLTLNNLLKGKNKKYVLVANIPASKENEKDGADYWRILHMNDINDIYKKAQQKAGFSLISMYELFGDYLKENQIELSEVLADGLHPNDKGYEIIFNLMKKALNV